MQMTSALDRGQHSPVVDLTRFASVLAQPSLGCGIHSKAEYYTLILLHAATNVNYLRVN